MNIKKSGKVIFWNPAQGYGFLQFLDSSDSIFFHKCNCNYKEVELFDYVSFDVFVIERGKYKGKNKAVNIDFEKRGGIKGYDLRIGSVQHWNGRSGFIDYPTDGKKIILYNTRLMYSKELKDGELVVFNPVVSFKDKSKLFAFFAYPLRFEKDIAFLKSQYINYQIPALKDYILDISKKLELTHTERFELELLGLGYVNKGEDYLSLVDIIKRYKADYDYSPEHNILEKYVADNFLIQLWETQLIDTYDVNVIKDYFIKARADTKRFIAKRVNKVDLEIILNQYFKLLQNANKLDRVSNDLKTFLSIIYRNEETRNSELYEKVKSSLMLRLTSDELIDLCFSGYIELNESFVVKNLKATDDDSIRKLLQLKDSSGNRVYENLLSKIYEQYFVDYVHSEANFNDEYPNLIRYLRILESDFKLEFERVIKMLKSKLTNHQQFILWILDVNIDFDSRQYVYDNLPQINHYFRLRYCLRLVKENVINDLDILASKVPVDIIGLKESIGKFEWNEVIYPTIIIGAKDKSFLGDVTRFNKIFKAGLDVIDLADYIYNSQEKYNEIHVRLWLYYLNDDIEYYNYVGFRNCFKNLTSLEQKEFRDRANERDFAEITSYEVSEVKPCLDFKYKGTGKVYSALVENIYFGNGFIRLRMEDREYTQESAQEFSSTGLNRIPPQSSLNQIQIEVAVENTKIINVKGLDELFTRIHTGEITKALGSVKKELSMARGVNSYAEDWKLKKEVIDFLNTSQDMDKEVKQVYEPKNIFRRLDDSSGTDSFELTCLYTIKLEYSYAIVWENIDLTEDRATYMFKSLPENYEIQMQKISDAIVSFSQLRSALSSLKEDEKLQIFKENLGFIGSIRKKRGANESFKKWCDKFQDILKERIPRLPDEDELAQLEGWSPFISHSVRINKQKYNFRESARIIEKNLAVTDQLEGGGYQFNEHRPKVTMKVLKDDNDENGTHENLKSSYKEELTILRALELFNQYFTENLKLNIL